VDPGKCTGCGLCAEICHEHCIGLIDRTATIDYALCSTCTQCIAVCPERALSWNCIPPLPFEAGLLPSVEQLDELLMERRTVRSFTEKSIDRETLEKLVGYAVFAPTHGHNLRAIIVDDPEIIRLADRAIFGFVKRLYSLVYKPAPVSALFGLMPAAVRSEYFRARPKLEAGLRTGRAFRSSPAALVLLVGDRRVPLSVESAQYALYNIALAAQVRAIGARNLVGNQMILNRNKAFRRRLRLGAHERILGTLGLGHPSVRFRNKVAGRKLDTSWNDRRG
jgi:ferredoxin